MLIKSFLNNIAVCGVLCELYHKTKRSHGESSRTITWNLISWSLSQHWVRLLGDRGCSAPTSTINKERHKAIMQSLLGLQETIVHQRSSNTAQTHAWVHVQCKASCCIWDFLPEISWWPQFTLAPLICSDLHFYHSLHKRRLIKMWDLICGEV